MKGLRIGLPTNSFVREIFGILFVLGYLLVLPVMLAKVIEALLRDAWPGALLRDGLSVPEMMALPIKMLMRWLFNLKYIVAIPEFFFNI